MRNFIFPKPRGCDCSFSHSATNVVLFLSFVSAELVCVVLCRIMLFSHLEAHESVEQLEMIFSLVLTPASIHAPSFHPCIHSF